MLSESRPGDLDLLVLGGLTIDRFADGSSAAGGSVLHVARAAAARGLRVGAMTAAGPEAEAQAAVVELRALVATLAVAGHPGTATFLHRETRDGRQLRLERPGGPLAPTVDLADTQAPAVLFAPVAGEVPIEALGPGTAGARRPIRGAILQGWLRGIRTDGEVQAKSLPVLDGEVVATLSQFSLLVASREDLAGEAADPASQLASLRNTFGDDPALVVTDGSDGLWLAARAGDPRHLPAPRRVGGVSTVGAGDVLAAFMLLATTDESVTLIEAAQRAMEVVAQVLEARARA